MRGTSSRAATSATRRKCFKETQPEESCCASMCRKKCFSISSEGVSNNFQSKALLDEYLISFWNRGLVWKSLEVNQPWDRDALCWVKPGSHTPGCRTPEVLTLGEHVEPQLSTQLKKKKKREKITTLKNVWYLKRFSRESRQNLQGSCFIIHPDPCTAHSAFYMLPYVQLTNWDDRNSVCFTAYIFNLHSEILQQKSAGSCDKNNLHVLRDASFFKPHL